MSPRKLFIEAVAVLAGAIIGLLVADLASFLFAGTDFLALFVTVRVVVALLVVALFAFFYARLPKTPAVLACLAAGVFVPALAEALFFSLFMGWNAILFAYAVFAVVALLTYRFVHANGTVRSLAADMAGSDRPGP